MSTEQTRYWFDTEFIEDGATIELLSIGVVCEDGRQFYAESADADWSQANEWVIANVLPHLHLAGWTPSFIEGVPPMPDQDRGHRDVMHRAEIAGELLKFVNHGQHRPEFWAYYGDYDWVVLCQLYGRMIDLPQSWPMFAMDVKQYAVMLGDPRLPEQTSIEHHALADARWTREAWQFLREIQHVDA